MVRIAVALPLGFGIYRHLSASSNIFCRTIDICLDEEAGRFSYMDELPPNIIDSHSNRSKFLASLANDVGRFVIA